jgi:hypothetical protein
MKNFLFSDAIAVEIVVVSAGAENVMPVTVIGITGTNGSSRRCCIQRIVVLAGWKKSNLLQCSYPFLECLN